MSEIDPFAAFKEGQPPTEAPKEKKKRERKAKPKGNGKPPTKAAAEKPAAPAPKKERKARKPRQVKEFRLPISTFLEIGSLSGEEGGALMSIASGLQKLPKRSRTKITQALTKIFA